MEAEQGGYEMGWGEPGSAAAVITFRAWGCENNIRRGSEEALSSFLGLLSPPLWVTPEQINRGGETSTQITELVIF